MKRVLVTEPISEAGLRILREEAEVDVRLKQSPEQLMEIIGEYDALLVRSETKVTRELLEKGRRLAVVGRAGVGVDNIDLAAATALGILVVNAPSGNTIAAAEHTLAMMLAVMRRIPAAQASVQAGRWERSRFVGHEVYGKCLGVIGLGRIGREVARRAMAMGMTVVAHDPHLAQSPLPEVPLLPLEELLARADVITLHTPKVGTLLGEEELQKVRRGVYLVNCARGGLIDEEALVRALDDGRVAGAALDVFAKEPPPPDHPLFGRENVVTTPHLGASTEEAQEGVALSVAEAVRAALRGEPVATAVNLPIGDPQEALRSLPWARLAGYLGRLLGVVSAGAVTEVRVEGPGGSLLTHAALQGLLSTQVSGVNLVNAPHLARARGIRVVEGKVEDGSEPSLRVSLRSVTGEEHEAQGTVTARGESYLTGLDGYSLLAPVSRHLLVCTNRDRPGMIGRVGGILGEKGINIAGMYVGRRSPGGPAVMVVQVDEEVPESALESIRGVAGIFAAWSITFPDLSGARSEEEE